MNQKQRDALPGCVVVGHFKATHFDFHSSLLFSRCYTLFRIAKGTIEADWRCCSLSTVCLVGQTKCICEGVRNAYFTLTVEK